MLHRLLSAPRTVLGRGRLLTAAVVVVAAALGVTSCEPTPPVKSWTGHYTMTSGRDYYLHANLATTGKRPLVVILSALGWSVEDTRKQTGAEAYSEKNGFAVAWGVAISRSWNAGSCCLGAADDVSYITDVIRDAQKHLAIDPTRVYVWGLSNGGMMAWRYACEAPGMAAAAGVVAGALMVPCTQTKVVVRHLHGGADTTVPYKGGAGCCDVTFPPATGEETRVAPGSSVVLKAWSGNHTWPSWGTDWLWQQMKTITLPAPPPTPAPTTPAPPVPEPTPTGTPSPVPPVPTAPVSAAPVGTPTP